MTVKRSPTEVNHVTQGRKTNDCIWVTKLAQNLKSLYKSINPFLLHTTFPSSGSLVLHLLLTASSTKSQRSLHHQLNQLKSDHNDKVRVKEVKFWHPSGHNVGPACQKFVPLPLHSSSGCIQQYGELVAEQTELLWPEQTMKTIMTLWVLFII